MSKTFIISNLVYISESCGPTYLNLWLENQLKSLCDPTNLPELKKRGYKLEYALFSDDVTMMQISRHPNFMALSAICEVHFIKMTWPPDTDKFQSRYGLLTQMIQSVLPVALEKDAYLGCWVADLVFAKRALPDMLARLEAGHDAVFNNPIRGAADSIQPVLQSLPGAPTDLELFDLCYRNLHHLWVASHWDAPLFSKFPYSMLWNSGSGLVAHNFGVTPIVFKPTEEMKAVKGGIDSDLPQFFKNPFWATDWTDAPVAGVEPLSNGHYPPFLIHRADEDFVVKWAAKHTMSNQAEHLDKALYYPCKSIFKNTELAAQAQETAMSIQKKMKNV